MIEILAAGPFATVQDLGRPTRRGHGISVAGAMDALALRGGNLMLGNDEDAAGIETALAPLRVKFTEETAFAVTGAAARVRLDGIALPNWWCGPAHAGQVLEIMPSTVGMWTYLTVAGGINCATVLGSRSTDLKLGIGGPFEGKAIPTGAKLQTGVSDTAAIHALGGYALQPPQAETQDGHPVLRVIPAREYDEFVDSDRAAFWETDWRVGQECNRMGYRLTGPTLHTTVPLSLPSYPLVSGIIQVPPSGQPIIQLAEANTCGGYPKFGVIIQADLRTLVQSRPASILRMRQVTADQGVAARAEHEAFLRTARNAAKTVAAWT